MIPCMSINGDSAAEAVAVLARPLDGAEEAGHLLRLRPDQFATGLRTTPENGSSASPSIDRGSIDNHGGTWSNLLELKSCTISGTVACNCDPATIASEPKCG